MFVPEGVAVTQDGSPVTTVVYGGVPPESVIVAVYVGVVHAAVWLVATGSTLVLNTIGVRSVRVMLADFDVSPVEVAVSTTDCAAEAFAGEVYVMAVPLVAVDALRVPQVPVSVVVLKVQVDPEAGAKDQVTP